jgi:hypothetical protein
MDAIQSDVSDCGPEDQEPTAGTAHWEDNDAPADLMVDESTPTGPVIVKTSKLNSRWLHGLVEDDSESGGTDSGSDQSVESVVDDKDNENEEDSTSQNDGEEEDSIAAIANADLPRDDPPVLVHEVWESYQCVPDRKRFVRKLEWTGVHSKGNGIFGEGENGCRLQELMEADDGDVIGQCLCIAEVTETAPSCHLSDCEKSMILLIDYCNHKPRTSRGFLDGLLDLIADEMNVRGFDPRKRPRRDTVSRKVMKQCGPGCGPVVQTMALGNEGGLIVAQEEGAVGVVGSTEESALYLAVPQQIDNRERFLVDIVSYNAKNMIIDLLQDTTIFGDMANLVVNKENPFLPYKNTDGICDEILDGSWYGETVQRLKAHKADPFKEDFEFVLPLVMYVDKTGTTMNQRYPLEPFIFTTAVIRRRLRNLPTSWRPLGLIPDLETKSSAEKSHIRSRNKGATSQMYHLALEQLLKGLQEVQDAGMVEWLQIGKFKKKVRIRPEVACIINDGKSADMMTLRVPSFADNRRVSRCCQTPQKDADQLTTDCAYVSATEQLKDMMRTAGMSAKQAQQDPKWLDHSGEKPSDARSQSIVDAAKKSLDELSFHPVHNAFLARCIRFGLDPRNIWGANPVDLMHAFQSGILMYLVKMVLDKLPPQKQVALDRLVHKLFHCLRSGERGNYPRMNFSKGFSKLTLLTSDEWAGKLFVVLIVLHTEEGKQIFDKAKTFDDRDAQLPPLFGKWTAKEAARNLEQMANGLEPDRTTTEDHQQEDDKPPGKEGDEEPEEMARKCSAADFTELAEALLCFHAWYKMGVNRLDKNGNLNTSVIRDSVAKLLGMVRWFCPRKKGNGWKLQKFHDILHLAIDMERFGPPSNFDAGPMESGLKYWAKLPALTSQTRGYNTFAKQVAMRTFEFQCFAKAIRKNGLRKNGLPPPDAPTGANQPEPPVLKGSRYRVYYNGPDSGQLEGASCGVTTHQQSKAIRRKKCQGAFIVSPVIEDYLRFEQSNAKEHGDEVVPPSQNGNEIYWELRTEMSFCLRNNVQERVTLRCHPNYQNEGPWHDWVIAHFQQEEQAEDEEGQSQTQFEQDCVPCKVLAVTQHPRTAQAWLLVHGCKFRPDPRKREKDSVLLEHWELSYQNTFDTLPEARHKRSRDGRNQSRARPHHMTPQLTWIQPESIIARCLCIEEEPGVFQTVPVVGGKEQNRVMLVRQRNRWPLEFTD